ncbi:hypothetical protein Vretimale_5749 [Volvox reticuliferus]|uniref:Uncharacterized protein n=1 Tax=Volvox reticuliferus TaxID=1737510 RepID=A0A8J4G659_9CHLO|nr:hypothetical protein Vretimale_5749 [Volvox reticuliferus]
MRATYGLPRTHSYVALVTQRPLPVAAPNRNPASTRGLIRGFNQSHRSIIVAAVAPRAEDSNTGAASIAPIGGKATSTPGAAPGAVATPAAARDDFAVDQRPIILFDGVCKLARPAAAC